MDFSEAIQQILLGNKVTRPLWLQYKQPLSMYLTEGSCQNLVQNDMIAVLDKEDLEATDWEVYIEEPKPLLEHRYIYEHRTRGVLMFTDYLSESEAVDFLDASIFTLMKLHYTERVRQC